MSSRRYASGKHAVGICARSGRKMRLMDLVSDGQYPNMLVDPDWFEPKHPQELLPKVGDPIGLFRPAPDPAVRQPFCYESRPVFNPRTGLIEFQQVFVGGPGCPQPTVYDGLAWGRNLYGALGIDNPTNFNFSTPEEIALADIISLHTGSSSSFAVTMQGIHGFGRSVTNIFAVAPFGDVRAPLLLEDLGPFDFLATDGSFDNHSAMGIVGGRLYSWGSNVSGLTAQGTDAGVTATPTQVGALEDWQMVSLSAFRGAGICEGRLYAWGTTIGSPILSPQQVGSADNWVAVSAGALFSCAINADGDLYTWGSNNNNALGRAGAASETPQQVGDAGGWTHCAAGNNHGMGIRNGRLMAWGSNANGRTGRGTTAGTTATPTQVGAFEDWIYVDTDFQSSAMIREGGDLYTCGSNEYGQTGLGTTLGNTTVPTIVGGGFARVEVSEQFMLALREKA